jgi:hypothetical protein
MFGLKKLFERKEDTTFVLGQTEMSPFQIKYQVLGRMAKSFGINVAPGEDLADAIMYDQGFECVDSVRGIYKDPIETKKNLETDKEEPILRNYTDALETAQQRFIAIHNLPLIDLKTIGINAEKLKVDAMSKQLVSSGAKAVLETKEPALQNGRGV